MTTKIIHSHNFDWEETPEYDPVEGSYYSLLADAGPVIFESDDMMATISVDGIISGQFKNMDQLLDTIELLKRLAQDWISLEAVVD